MIVCHHPWMPKGDSWISGRLPSLYRTIGLTDTIVGLGVQLLDNEDPYRLTAIAAGIHHSLAIKDEPCQSVAAGNLNNDCKADLADLAIMTLGLIDCSLDPARIPK